MRKSHKHKVQSRRKKKIQKIWKQIAATLDKSMYNFCKEYENQYKTHFDPVIPETSLSMDTLKNVIHDIHLQCPVTFRSTYYDLKPIDMILPYRPLKIELDMNIFKESLINSITS